MGEIPKEIRQQIEGPDVNEIDLYQRLYGTSPPVGISREDILPSITDNRGHFRVPKETNPQEGE